MTRRAVLVRQCLDRRIGEVAELRGEIATGEQARNAAGTTVDWPFGVREARTALARLYPVTTPVAEDWS